MRDRKRFSPGQCRGARGLLCWSAEDLARRARLEPEAIELYEAGNGDLSDGELAMVGDALNQAGVIAIRAKLGGEGVRFSRPPDDAGRRPSVATASAFSACASEVAHALPTRPDQRDPYDR